MKIQQQLQDVPDMASATSPHSRILHSLQDESITSKYPFCEEKAFISELLLCPACTK